LQETGNFALDLGSDHPWTHDDLVQQISCAF